MIIKKELVKREIAGDVILVPVGKAVVDNNGLFVLNELGAFIWDILPQVNNADDICRAVLETYDVTPEEAQRDIAEFLDRLRKYGII